MRGLRFAQALAAALLAVAVAAPPSPRTTRARTVKIIVPFGAGGPADVYARFVGQHLQEMLKPAVRDREPRRAPAPSSAPTRPRSRRPTATRC